ncbi:MAG: YgjP-like metallopeptidase domain-containing protein [Thermomicrobiales bacterium]
MPDRIFHLTIDGESVEIRLKRMKTIRLHIEPPDGRVWVSAPLRTSRRRIEEVVREHWPSIRAKQERIRARYLSEERAVDVSERRLLGAVYRIEGDDEAAGAQARIDGDRIVVDASIVSDPERLTASLDALQADLLRQELTRLIPDWEARLGVRVSWWGIRRMRTRWGSCSVQSGRIRFSLNLGAGIRARSTIWCCTNWRTCWSRITVPISSPSSTTTCPTGAPVAPNSTARMNGVQGPDASSCPGSWLRGRRG